MQSDRSPTDRTRKSASVAVEEIWKRIGSTQVLSGVSLDIQAGEFVTLLGPSGSGKTSTLMAVAGFVAPDKGRIVVGGRDVTDVPPGRERDMGIVFQNFALFPHMNVAKNVAYPLSVRGVPRRETAARVTKVLELVQLTGLEHRRPAQLSGGQQQRVALARALVFEPSVLLMDEPLGSLDVRLKQELQWEIRRLQRSIGATIVYVTHDQNEALLLSDRVALLRDGRVEQYGPPQELYRTPRTVFTARFLGESNLIVGRYEARPLPGVRVPETGLFVHANGVAGTNAIEGDVYAALLRPEALSIAAPGVGRAAADPSTQDGTNAVEGIVQEAVFVGQATRYLVSASSLAQPLIVQQAARAGAEQLSPGSPARVSWDASDVHLIPAGARDDRAAA